MSTRQDEFFAAFQALEARRERYRILMAQIATGEPYDHQALRRDLEDLDVLYKAFQEKAKPFVH
jgi:hypothetical protein